MESKLDRLRRHLCQIAPGGNTESMLPDNDPEYTEHIATRDSRAPEVLEKFASGEDLDQDELFIAEAIILPDKRPAIDVIGGDFTIDDPTWRHLDSEHDLHQSIKSTLVSIGRIDLPGHPTHPYGGTGFVVGSDLIMTNRHVAEMFASGLGVSGLRFQPGLAAGINFKHELGSDGSMMLDVVSVKMIHPYWDMALLRVQGLPDKHPALRLSLDDPDELVDRDIVCVGYPAFDHRNDAAVQKKVFRGVYEVKRLQPGKIRGRGSTKMSPTSKAVDVGTHDSSTLGGNSGSAVVDPQTGQVLALHFAGIYLKENYAVPMCDLAKDQRIVDLGLTFAGKPRPHSGAWDGWWTETREVAMSTDVSGVPPEELMTLVQRVFAQFHELQEQVERLRAAAGDRQRSGPVVTPPAEPPPPGSPTALTKTLESLASQAHSSVRGVLQGGRGLRHYLSQIDKLNPDERRDIVDQAVTLLEGYYAHLQLKKAMYGFDPVQRLRLLRRRLGRYGSEIAFHNELTDIFTNLRDLHTNYLLPDYFARSAAFLPFQVKHCWENGERIYIVTQTMPGVTDPNFQRGVRITYWNAVPIDRAVEIAASYHAGSNPAARHARGVDGLTLRSLRMSAPPDDEWVIVGYVDLAGQQREFRAEWSVVDLPEEESATDGPLSAEAATALGLDLEGDLHRRLNALLYSPEKLAERRRIKVAKESANYTAEYGSSPDEAVTVAAATAVHGLQSTLPDVFDVSALNVLGRTIGYLRIRTFMVNSDELFVAEVVRLLEHADFPKDGMVLDARGNGGGLIWAGERLLQLFTNNQIEPTRAQFAVTPLTVALSPQAAFAPWKSSLERAVETGASFSAAFPITPSARCNDIGRRYPGPVVLITDARCYSTTDMFAAGFQDHGIGKILGVDDNTGAGGANVWTIDVLRHFAANGPVHALPRGGDMRVAIRRTLRVGPQAGTEIEDLGVEPDETHQTTRRDLLQNDGDLLEAAVRLL